MIPGVTELVEANAVATAERTGATPEQVMARLLAQQGVAAAVVFLASEQVAWISGAILDGSTLRST